MSSLNLDGSASPWFHVHFTLPNQGNTSRKDVKYDNQRKRIKDLIQNKDAFLAPTCQRGNLSRTGANKPVKKPKDDYKKRLDNADSSGNGTLRTPWVNQNSIKKSPDTRKKGSFIEDRIFIDTQGSNTTNQQDRKSILPPLGGSKAGVMTGCLGQQDKVTESKTDKNEAKNADQRIERKTENKLSIADCYDLCNWKPQNSLCKQARPLVGILKQNTRTPRPQGQSSIPTDSSESSGNETDNEATKRNKKVRFAKGTKFSPSIRSKKYRKKRNYLDSKFESDKEIPGEESNLEDMIELSFREFIERKRLERSKVMAEITKADSNMFCFLKEETKLPKVNTTGRQHKQQSKRNGSDQEERGSKVDTLLPTVVN